MFFKVQKFLNKEYKKLKRKKKPLPFKSVKSSKFLCNHLIYFFYKNENIFQICYVLII